ncbi:MAG: SRPBCC domain-containing protein [Xanthobacteraceae bacterium]
MTERRIETGIDIDAPPSRVWTVLTDFARMPTWNPFIKSISGNLTQGARLSVYIAPPGKSGMRFKPTVLSVRPERELRWLGQLLFSGIFDGEHYFLLEPIGDSRTRLTQGEKFSGLLVGLLGGTLSATEEGFKAMNTALKQQAEQNNAQENAPAP